MLELEVGAIAVFLDEISPATSRIARRIQLRKSMSQGIILHRKWKGNALRGVRAPEMWRDYAAEVL